MLDSQVKANCQIAVKLNEARRAEGFVKECYEAWVEWTQPDNLDLMPNCEMLDNLVKIFECFGHDIETQAKAESMFLKGVSSND